MKSRNLILITLIALTLAATPFVFAGPHRGGHRGGDFGALAFLGHAREELDLSDQQVDEIKAIFKDLHEQNATYREQMRGGLDGIMKTLLANPNNISGAQAIIDQQAQAERALKMNLLNATSKALNVLNADQRAKLGTMIEERQARRDQRRAFHKERGSQR
jgi:Spy/CpxP family protein refolding chaperone